MQTDPGSKGLLDYIGSTAGAIASPVIGGLGATAGTAASKWAQNAFGGSNVGQNKDFYGRY